MLDATGAPGGLEGLEARLRQDLAWLELPAKSWVPPRLHQGAPVTDVVVIGGGMCGLVAAAALRLLGITRIRVLDRAAAGQEGPWITYARMQTLRSPKTLTGPALDLPALTFRAWFEAQFGAAGFAELGKIPRGQWMEYLVWYRRVMGIRVENGIDVCLMQDAGDGLIAVRTAGGETILCRHLVMATGRDGLGSAWLPDIAYKLPRALRAHSRDAIDFSALAGKRVGVVGAGASAMDNAATALEAGCARLDLFVRRAALPRVNKFTGIGSPGVVHGVEGLPDDWKWRFLDLVLREQTPPPRDSTLRVSRHQNAYLHLASPIEALHELDGAIVLLTPSEKFDLDFLIFATGFRVDFASRPELAEFGPHIRFWGDTARPGLPPNEELAASPDLGEAFSFQEKRPGSCPALRQVHCFNYPATLSHGKLSGDIPAISAGAKRLARGIARALFVADRESHFAALAAYATPELLGDEWPDRP